MKASVCLAGIGLALVAVALVAVESATETNQELLNLLIQECGSCHGLTRQGGLGPPLLPESLSNKSDESLLAIILEGSPGTPMPPWKELLSEQQARWLIGAMRRGEGL